MYNLSMHRDAGVVLAKTAGFCPGVKKAIDCVLELSRSGRPIYTLGPLIHNTQVIKMLEGKNIRAVNSPDEIKDKNAILVIRAHGIAPQLEKQIRALALEIVDATCPLVKNVHAVIEKYGKLGYDTVIVGDKDHAEVAGLVGCAVNKCYVVANAREAKKLPHLKKVNVVSQTTQEEEVFLATAEAVRKNCDECAISNTICAPTSQRQRETIELSRNVDLMIVVGARHSANTTRLAKLCAELCPCAAHIESEEELDPLQIKSCTRVGITAGASTPSWMTERVLEKIRQIRKPGEKISESPLKTLWNMAIDTCIYTSFAAVSLNYVCMKLQGARLDGRLLTLSWLFVLSLHIINRSSEKASAAYEKHKTFLFQEHRRAVIYAGILAGAGAMAIAAVIGWRVFLAVGFFWALGIIYPFRHILNVKGGDFPGSKDIVTALGWGFVCAYIPAFSQGIIFTKANYLALFYAILIVFIRSVMLGISAVHTDLIVGRENFYKALGHKVTDWVLFSLLTLLTIILATLFAMGWKTSLVIALLAGNFYAILCFLFYFMGKISKGVWAETFIDGQFLILGALAWLSQMM
ncbi:MAG: 4-hydroxy-3-methylbut-2-enyl diphosphate reductase [Elusimicrobia bacterium]|nr:4-hydroxy-3-methylbut-2-enyl diphosphate reductase [Elusimicrobiota bacterium]